VDFGDDEDMHWRERVQVLNGNGLLILIKDVSGEFMSNNLTKWAIFHSLLVASLLPDSLSKVNKVQAD
jgi:hypothetical protein